MSAEPQPDDIPGDLFVSGLLAGLSFGRNVPDADMRRAIAWIVEARDAIDRLAELEERFDRDRGRSKPVEEL